MERYKEQEIDIMTMLMQACKCWRRIVFGALAIAFLASGCRLAMGIITIHDSKTYEKIKEDYEVDKQAYKSEGLKLQMDIERTSKELDLQKEYVANSILMKLDTNNEWTGRVNCYVDTKYQIMPGTTVQNENPAFRIVNAYYDYSVSGGFYTEVMSQLTMDISDVKYLKEVLSVWVDDDRYAVIVDAVAENEKNCQELLTVATDVLQKRTSEIVKQVGDHSLAVTQVKPYSQINSDRERYQLQQRTLEQELEVENAELGLDYKEWREKENDLRAPVLDEKDAIKDAIKWFIIAGVAGAILVAGVYCVGYLLSAKYLYGASIPAGLHEIGYIPAKSSKKGNAIDKLIKNIFGQNIKAEEYDSRVATAALHMSQLCSKLEGASSIALVSDMDMAKLSTLAEEMNKALEGGCKILPSGNILLSKEASKETEQASAAVFVIEQDYSRKKDLESMIAQLKAYDKCILGVVITNVN